MTKPAGEFDTSPTAFLSTLQEGVGTIEAAKAVFTQLDELRQTLSQEALDVEAVASFFEALTSGEPDQNLQQALLEQAPQRSKVMTPVGYASMLVAGREVFIQNRAEEWAQRPEVQAFIGQEYTFSSFSRTEDSGAWMEADGITTGLFGENVIGGRITQISALSLGAVTLDNCSFSYKRNAGGFRGIQVVTGADADGGVSHMFAQTAEDGSSAVKVEPR